jgi:hypothetical protein
MRWWKLKKRDADLEQELRSDLELEEEEQRENGLSPEEALYAARRAFGNATLIKEQTHEAWGWVPLERFLQDFRYALRQLARSPGFAAAAILTLGLGIGASTSIFSVADAVLLRPLPYPNPGRLVRVWEQMPNGHRPNLAESNFEDFLTQNNTFASLAAYDYRLASVSGGSEPARVNISGRFQRILPDARRPAIARPPLCSGRTAPPRHARYRRQLWLLAAVPRWDYGSLQIPLGSRWRLLPRGRRNATWF